LFSPKLIAYVCVSSVLRADRNYVTTDTYIHQSEMPASAAEAFFWHERPGAFERLNPPWDPVKVLQRDPSLAVGAKTVIQLKIAGVPVKWTAEHTAYEAGVMFRDEQTGGPFSKWVHTHRFVSVDEQRCRLIDEIEFAPPLGALGQVFAGGPIRAQLAQMFGYRHALLRADLERHRRFASAPRQTIAVTGASGLLGTALSAFLTTGGHTVRAVKRGDFSAIDGADAIVHLAGAPIGVRWTDAVRGAMVESRVDYTRALVAAIGAATTRPGVLLGGSAIGVYGDRDDEELDESSATGARGERGAAMLAGLCADWEAESIRAKELKLRVALLRTGVVLTPNGGALSQLLGPFSAGIGGRAGSGRQWMSWIGLEDTIGAIHHALMTDIDGPVNLTAESPVTNRDFARTLGHVLRRPSFVPAPTFALEAMFGEMAEATLLASQRVLPRALQSARFEPLHPKLEDALRFCLGR